MIRRSWPVISLLALLLAAIGLTVGFFMTPVYRCTTVLIANDSGEKQGLLGAAMGSLGGLASVAGLGLGGASQNGVTEALAVLQSRQFIEEFIANRNLLPELFPKKWDDATKSWKVDTKTPTAYLGFRRFSQNIMDVYQDKKTNLVTLGIDWSDREEGAVWANELVDRVNERMRERAISEADQTIKYLETEMRSADTVEVRLAISSMLESQLKTRALAAVRKQYAFRVVDPARPVDEEFRLRPHKGIYTIAGGIVGLLAGIALTLLTASHRKTVSSSSL